MSKTVEEVKKIIENVANNVIQNIIGGKAYNQENSVEWANSISNTVVTELKSTENYKFFVTTIIMCKGESGQTMAGACLWNSEKDGTCVVKREIEDMVCIVNVFFTPLM